MIMYKFVTSAASCHYHNITHTPELIVYFKRCYFIMLLHIAWFKMYNRMALAAVIIL